MIPLVLINRLFYVSRQAVISILVHSFTTKNRNYWPKIQLCFITKTVFYSNWILTNNQSNRPFQPLDSSSILVPSVMATIVSNPPNMDSPPLQFLFHLWLLSRCSLFLVTSSLATKLFIFLSKFFVKFGLTYLRGNTGRPILWGLKNTFYNILLGTITLTYNIYFTSTLTWPITLMRNSNKSRKHPRRRCNKSTTKYNTNDTMKNIFWRYIINNTPS